MPLPEVLLPGAVVRSGAVVRRALLDDRVGVGPDARVGGSEGDVALLGRAAELSASTVVPAGGRLPDEDGVLSDGKPAPPARGARPGGSARP